MHYRKLVEGDIEAVSHIHRRACLIAYAFMNWSYSDDDVRTWYAEKFLTWDWGLVAEDGREIVGFIACTGVHLDQLFVDPDHQKRGIGSILLTAALERTPAVETLNVFEQNTIARGLYERHGFSEVGRFINETEQAMELVYRRLGKFKLRHYPWPSR